MPLRQTCIAIITLCALTGGTTLFADDDADGMQQTTPEPAATAQVAPPLSSAPLQPGDVLAVEVADEPDLSGTYYVRPEGNIELPMIGAVPALGRTTGELTADITTGLKRYVLNPRVSIVQVGGAARAVSILGSVNGPGSYDLRLYPNLLSLLAAAGGPTREADLDRTTLIRDDEPALVAAPDADGTGRVLPRDVKLEAGDTVFIPSLTERAVRVVGAVAQPGLVPLEESMTVSRAILDLGGPLPSADLRSVQLLRGVERRTLDLRPIIRPESAADDEARDEHVQLGDIILVPERQDRNVHVIGAVNAPGPQPAVEAEHASKAVALAGGATEQGDLSHAYILRHGARIDLDLIGLLKPGSTHADDPGRDAPIQPGDIVVVPDSRPVFVLGAVQQAGHFPPDRARTVSEALFGAGGLTHEADRSSAYVMRAGEQIPVDLRELLEEGDASVDIALRPDDALVIPSTPQNVHVVGQVATPGAFPLSDAETLVDLWGQIGGALPTANMRACVLLRGANSEVVDMRALIDDGEVALNRTLEAGDTLLIPKISDEVYVFGEVREPGRQPIHEGDTIIDVIARAGGPSSAAKIKQIALIRRGDGADLSDERIRRTREEEPSAARPSRDWHSRRSGRPSPRASAEEDRSSEGRTREKIARGDRSIDLFDLAAVREGDPAYLARPGDVIWVPPKTIEQSIFQDMLRNLIGLPFYALF
ncbi:MAG: SLBB domain-containing protein [Armatimonadota bacterium]